MAIEPARVLKTLEALSVPETIRRSRPVILVADSHLEDRALLQWAFEGMRNQVEVRCVGNGEEALELMLQNGWRTQIPECSRPRLVLLEIDLPIVPGLEVLRRIRACPTSRTVPVVVFSGSDCDEDVARAYELGANSYISKPSTSDGYRAVTSVLEEYWLRQVRVPDCR